jgi:glycosyltransferase involved in cell wall biosynthesis
MHSKAMQFSIVIPTRNRPEYLPGAVKSALEQTDSENVEVIVFDNASSIHASQTLSSLSGYSNLRIVRVEKPLPMRDSWETALALAKEGFVTILGDDDAILPNAVNVGRKLSQSYDVDVIRWDRAHYTWPNNIDQATSNICKIPLGRTAYIVDGHKVLRDLGRGKSYFAATPLIYSSWVSVNLINSIKEKHGRIFHSALPDVDSGIAFAFCAKKYLSLNFPLGICGVSPKSNGAQAHVLYKLNPKIKVDFDTVNDFNTLNTNAQISKTANQIELTWDLMVSAYKKMADTLGIPESVFKLNERYVIKCIIADELPRMPVEQKRLYLEKISRDDQLLRFTSDEKKTVAESINVSQVQELSPLHKGFDPFEQILTIDCDLLGIYDSASLAPLIDNMLGLNVITKNILNDVYPKNWIKKIRSFAFRTIKFGETDFSFSKYRKLAV